MGEKRESSWGGGGGEVYRGGEEKWIHRGGGHIYEGRKSGFMGEEGGKNKKWIKDRRVGNTLMGRSSGLVTFMGLGRDAVFHGNGAP